MLLLPYSNMNTIFLQTRNISFRFPRIELQTFQLSRLHQYPVFDKIFPVNAQNLPGAGEQALKWSKSLPLIIYAIFKYFLVLYITLGKCILEDFSKNLLPILVCGQRRGNLFVESFHWIWSFLYGAEMRYMSYSIWFIIILLLFWFYSTGTIQYYTHIHSIVNLR